MNRKLKKLRINDKLNLQFCESLDYIYDDDISDSQVRGQFKMKVKKVIFSYQELKFSEQRSKCACAVDEKGRKNC
jgi:hypothetical protein